ncbi:MAG: hypothetical protein WC533_02025 [Candidatus Pacearchaeota archaeon]
MVCKYQNECELYTPPDKIIHQIGPILIDPFKEIICCRDTSEFSCPHADLLDKVKKLESCRRKPNNPENGHQTEALFG